MYRIKKYRRLYSCFMIILLLTSLIMPHQEVFADSSTYSSNDQSVDEFTLEKQKEIEALSQDKQSYSNNSSDTITRLIDGINFDDESEKAEFLLDGKVQSILFEELGQNETVDVIIRMKKTVDYNHLLNQTLSIPEKEDKGNFVVQQLQSVANSSQANILAELESLEANNMVSNIKQLWIINGIAATITKDALEIIAERDDVDKITHDFTIKAPDFQVDESKPRLPEWGLEKIYAPKVWGEYGLKGSGVVVGIMDTGVQGDHEALKHNYRGRNGEHHYSWIDLSGHNYPVPTDGHGHGTHVAGSAVGGGEGEPIGVAPEAEWIAVKIFDDFGNTTASAIHQAFEWFLAPGGDYSMAPDVVNNSWGSADTYRLEFMEDVSAWVAAGIFPLFAAGNNGPGVATINSPSSYPEAFAVGAINQYDQVASFSSRGPVYWENEDGELIRYIKPDVMAPGDRIYSALPNGGYGLASGTSMATPHVAGAIALLLESNSELSIPEISDLLVRTVRTEEFMGSLPNDQYGHGIINIYDAVTEAAFAGTLKGTVKNVNGEPISAEIYLNNDEKIIKVNEDGTFDVKVREGKYKVTVHSFGYQSIVDEIEIKKDQTFEVHWQLESAPTYKVEGNISYENNTLASYAYIRIENTPLQTIRADENGNFIIPSLPEGDYTFVISGKGIKPKTENINVNQNKEVNIKVNQLVIEGNADWTTARNNFSRNPVSSAEVDIESLEQSWSFQTPGEVLFSTPIVVEDKVVITTESGYVIVIDSETGEELWSVRLGRTNRSTPTVVDGIIYVSGGADYSIHALDLETGIKIWSTRLDYPAVYETPVFHDGVVYVSSYMDSNAKLTAINAESGKVIWEKEIGHNSFYGPSLGDNKLFVGSYDSKEIRAFSIDDGSELWRIQFENQGVSSSIVYNNEILYVVTNNFDALTGTLRAINANNGEILWEVSDIGNAEAGSPIVYDQLVVIGSASKPVLKAYDKNSGELKWETNHGSLMVNTGAVSSNGYLFTTDLAGTLKVYDVYTGERLFMQSLTASSTTGVALSEGRVILADRNAVHSFKSDGVIQGQITNSEGTPLEANVTIVELGQSVQADEDGHYILHARPGTYTIKISYNGYKQIIEEIKVVSGYTINQTYSLVKAELGSANGIVYSERTGELLDDVLVSIPEAGLETTTNNDGMYSFPEIYEGTYEIVFTKDGFAEKIEQITIKPYESTNFDINLAPIDVVVLHDYEGQMTKFLNSNGITAEEKGWEAIDNLSNYKVAYLNGAYTSSGPRPTEEQIRNVINAGIEHDVSIVFADTWGPSYGSLRYLAEFTNDPASYDSYQRSSGSVQLRVEEEHPIFTGLDIGQVYTAIDNSHLAWFNQYSGRELASIGPSEEGFQGTGVAYKAMSENSAHLLLSSHAVSPWTSPYNGWTPVQQRIVLNGLEYLIDDVQFGSLKGNIVDKEGNAIEDVKVEVVDYGYFVKTDNQGNYEIFHDEGSFKVSFSKLGYKTQTIDVRFVHGEPVVQDIIMESSDSGTISGQVINKITKQPVPYAEIQLYMADGTPIEQEIVGNVSGHYEITGLDEGEYILKIQEREFVYETINLYVSGEPIELLIELYPSPRVGIIGDTSTGSLQNLLTEYGIDSTKFAGMQDVIPEMNSYDVIFFTQEAAFRVNEELLEQFRQTADKHKVSVIYGDDYYSGAAINHLVTYYNDPKAREDHSSTTEPAGYVILEENPIFGDAQVGDFVEILVPARSNVTHFEDYSGYPLAEVKHSGLEETYGLGVAYKPRTSESMEILMSGHGPTILRQSTHYTKEGQDMFVNAILWATYTEFNEITGYVFDENGEPLHANVEILGLERDGWTDPETGYFSFGTIDAEFEIKVSAFGYKDHFETIIVNDETEPVEIHMQLKDNIGSISGTFIDENTLEGVNDVKVEVLDFPREAITDVSGYFEIDRLTPGVYTLVASVDGYVLQEFEVEVFENENTEFNRTMKPSPKVGVIVDVQTSSAVTLKEYLTNRGYIVEELFYDDLERIKEMDIIIANSDYNNNLIPEEDVFIEFIKEIDRTETPIIWTGNYGGRGSIRFLNEYLNNPKEIIAGRLSPTEVRDINVNKVKDHPILDGVHFDENDEFKFYTEYYYGINEYTGETILTSNHVDKGDLGSLVAVGGRTVNSIEVLLSTMTFGYGFTDGLEERKYFDVNRERIFNNAILWALDNEEALVGEIHGRVTNDLGHEVFANIKVEEIDYTLDTERDGTFFLGLDDGTYTLTIEAFGHDTESFTVSVERGKILEETFTLTAEKLGTIRGKIKDSDTNGGIENAKVQLVGTPLETVTDENGEFEIQAPVNEYQLRVVASGYKPEVKPVNVKHNEITDVEVALTISEKIAFVSSSLNANRIIPFLENNGYEVDFWLNSDILELMEQIDEYPLIILNDIHSVMNETVFREFIELTDEKEISVIFPSQWNSGTIRNLNQYYQNPAQVSSSYVTDHINYKVLEKHPIFSGFDVGDEIKILANDNSSVQYMMFEEYSGKTLADMTNESNRIGGGLAYDFRTSSSVHVLLGGLHVGSYGYPTYRWTEQAEQIYINAIDWALSASLGEIQGTVYDDFGQPLQGATVTIEGHGLTTVTDENGQYKFGVGIGTHQVKVSARGFVQQTKEVTVEDLGQSVSLDFNLIKTERASVEGYVKTNNDDGIANATITLTEINGNAVLSTNTDENGYYRIDEIIAGKYHFKLVANGYQTIEEDINLEEGEHLVKDFTLNEFNIAILGDHKTDLVNLFEEYGFAAQNRDWDIIDDVYNYRVIVVNASGTTEQLNKLIEKADEYKTSLVFTDTWGDGGSIELLEKVLGYNIRSNQGYNEGAVFIQPMDHHEIFEGFEDEIIKAFAETSPYSTFEGYEGIPLADLVVNGENKGSSIAYDFRSEDHMHLILSSFLVNNMIGPDRGWTDEGKQLFVKAIEWARDATQQLPEIPEWTIDDKIYSNGSIELTGKAEYRTKVSIIANGIEIATAQPTSDGTFTVEISELDEGVYELTLVAENFAGSVTSDKTIELIVDLTAPVLELENPNSDLIINKEVIDITGTVSDEHFAQLTINGDSVEVIDDQFNERLLLDKGENKITVIAKDLAGNETIIERIVTVNLGEPIITELLPDSDLYLQPGDEVEVSFVGTEGGQANFTIQLPMNVSTNAINSIQMDEYEPGKYKGTWIVPSNVNIQGAVIVVELIDQAGNRTSEMASGKLFISTDEIDRISGSNRYETAIEISKIGWNKAKTVILARGDDYADALAGVPLAYQLDAPILLTPNDRLLESTEKEIKRLGAENIIILGGNVAISDQVEQQLVNIGLDVRRIYGSNRFATAALIAKEMAPDGTNQIILANGMDFPDALSVASHAAINGIPIVITQANQMPDATKEIFKELNVKETIVVGGNKVISDDQLVDLPNVTRVSGKDRYETNIRIADHFGMEPKHLYVATGQQFADALTGAVLAAKFESFIALVHRTVPSIVSDYIEENEVQRITILGGTTAVSDDIISILSKLTD